MAVTGSYYIQVLTLSYAAITTGAAMGFADIAIMEMFHTVDYEADRASDPQKRTTIVFLGPEKGQTYVLAYICGAAVLFWILAFFYWQFICWSAIATLCIYSYWRYNPMDPWSIIHYTKKVTWANISAGLIYAFAAHIWLSF